MQHKTDTICAISSPPGIGGIAVIRVSGPEAFAISDRLFAKSVVDMGSHRLRVGEWRNGNTLIDEVVLSKFVGPKSFTGEDVIEISVHGSVYIQAEVMRSLMEAGCRPAGPGEFTQRAFLNGRMDLSQAEGVADLIASQSAASHRLAIGQMRGGFSAEIDTLRQQLIDFASLIELELDFSEEDVEFADRAHFRELIATLTHRVGELKDSFKLGNVLKNGIPVAIIGPPNSGKSTLLNVLLKEERAIVSEIAGTTRDAIEDSVVIEGTSFRFIDTAGIRRTEDLIESRGIDIAKQKAAEATIVLKLQDATELLADPEGQLYRDYFEQIGWQDDERTIMIYNKVDRLDDPSLLPEGGLAISALEQKGIDTLKNRLLKAVDLGDSGQADIIVTNARHYDSLSQVANALSDIETALDRGISGDLMAIDIRKALHHLGELTGTITTDDLLGNIFSRFCIGK